MSQNPFGYSLPLFGDSIGVKHKEMVELGILSAKSDWQLESGASPSL